MEIKDEHIMRLTDLRWELSFDELPYLKNVDDYGRERIVEAIAIIKNYESDMAQYVIVQLSQIQFNLANATSMDEKRRLLNNASTFISDVFKS